MKLATAPVNWNHPYVPEYRPWTPYPQLLDEMKAAGYSASEWATEMPKDPGVLGADLQARGLRLLGGYVGLELRTAAMRDQESRRGVEIGNFFQKLGANYLIVRASGEPRRPQQSGRADQTRGFN